MTLDEIEKMTIGFLKEASVMNTLEEEPAGLCFETVFPLQIFLLLKDIPSQIRTGRTEGKWFDGTLGLIDHFWIQIANGDGIIDPTIRQFNQNEPTIYVGNKNDSLASAKYPDSIYPSYFWFKEVYSVWSMQCDDLWGWKPENDTEIGRKFRVKSFTHRLRLASALFFHSKERMFQGRITTGDPYKDFHINLFFLPIIRFIRHCEEGAIQFDFQQLPESFLELQNYAKKKSI